jgi:hypothetical protein
LLPLPCIVPFFFFWSYCIECVYFTLLMPVHLKILTSFWKQELYIWF